MIDNHKAEWAKHMQEEMQKLYKKKCNPCMRIIRMILLSCPKED